MWFVIEHKVAVWGYGNTLEQAIDDANLWLKDYHPVSEFDPVEESTLVGSRSFKRPGDFYSLNIDTTLADRIIDEIDTNGGDLISNDNLAELISEHFST